MQPSFHHVAIETVDLAASVRWYEELFDAKLNWTLERFAPLTHRRLPGIGKQAELQVGELRFHLFERPGKTGSRPVKDVPALQHLCTRVASMEALRGYRERWQALYDSRRFSYALAEPATEIIVDDDGVASFYFLDLNGVEFEMTFIPDGVGR